VRSLIESNRVEYGEEKVRVKQTLERPVKTDVLTIKTDDVENTGISLAKNGAVFLGVNSTKDTESFYLLQGHLILVSKRD
jgi:hypothetical protein